jgi:hypothetical protein
LYSAELKRLAVGYARDAIRSGSSVWPVSKELGVWFRTLQRWLNETKGSTRATPSFRPVEVQAGAETYGVAIRVRTRSGHEVSGLDLASAVALLRGLEGQ